MFRKHEPGLKCQLISYSQLLSDKNWIQAIDSGCMLLLYNTRYFSIKLANVVLVVC